MKVWGPFPAFPPNCQHGKQQLWHLEGLEVSLQLLLLLLLHPLIPEMLIQSTILIVILLQLGAKRGYTQHTDLERELDDDFYRDVCEMQKSFRSPFVRAFYEENRQTEGCREEEKEGEEAEEGDDISIRPPAASLDQEIHVIQVTTPPLEWRPSLTAVARDSHQTAATRINLQIKSKQDSSAGILTKKLAFVLVSNVSIRWNIQLEGIDLSSQLQFWVTNGSRVALDRRLNMKVRQLKHLSSSSSGALLDWISQKLGQVTAMVEVKPNRSIVHVVGIAGLAKICREVTPKKTEQEIGGCLLRSSNGQRSKDVHILELEGNAPAAAAAADPGTGVGGAQRSVTVELHPRSTSSRPLLRRHLMLVLKSQHPTRWKVKTFGLRGTLDIVTDNFVDTGGVMMQTVGVVTERLSLLSGMDLVVWTSEKYGEPISYTYSRRANSFDLTVDGRDEADVDSDLTPSVICNPNSMTIGLRKKSLTNRFTAAHISLNDRSCRVKQNMTHYFWTTLLTSCGTIRTLQNDRITYRNAVLIHHRRSVSGPLLDNSGSGFEPRVDDENSDLEKSSEVRLDFHCVYPSEEIKYTLKLYKDPGFQLEMLNFPVIVSDKEMLYVEASSNQDSIIGLVIHSCIVQSSALDQPSYQLIRNGCSYEERVSWLGSGVSPHSRRFQFSFEESWNGSIVKCQLSSSCAPAFTDSSFAQILKCPPPDPRCSASHADKRLTLSDAFIKSASIGPIVTQERQRTTFALQDSSTQVTMATQDEVHFDCDRLNEAAEGLDPAAVVGIAFAAFAIGVLLTGTLWFIHSHTGSVKKHTKGIRSAEASGESTPSSTAPMAIHPRHHRI